MKSDKTTAAYLRENILCRMEENNISMVQLSLQIGASESYIQKVLSGEIRPSLERVDAISRYFGCEPWELISDRKEDTRAYVKTIEMMSQLSEQQLSVLHDYLEHLATLTEGSKRQCTSQIL